MSKVIDVTDESYETEVLGYDGPVVIDFYTPGCPPCRHMAPLVDQLAEDVDGSARIAKVNAAENRQLVADFEIRSVPTFVLVRDGDVTHRHTGFVATDTFKEWIAS